MCLFKIIWLSNAVFVQVMMFKNTLHTGGGRLNLVYWVTTGQWWVHSMSDSCPEPSSLGMLGNSQEGFSYLQDHTIGMAYHKNSIHTLL